MQWEIPPELEGFQEKMNALSEDYRELEAELRWRAPVPAAISLEDGVVVSWHRRNGKYRIMVDDTPVLECPILTRFQIKDHIPRLLKAIADEAGKVFR